MKLISQALTVFHYGDVHEARVGSVEYAAIGLTELGSGKFSKMQLNSVKCKM